MRLQSDVMVQSQPGTSSVMAASGLGSLEPAKKVKRTIRKKRKKGKEREKRKTK